MVKIISATFKDGVFKPDQPPAITDSTRVRLVVEPLDAKQSTQSDQSWTMLEQLWGNSTFDSQNDKLNRDQLHERR